MQSKNVPDLFSSSHWIFLMGIAAAILASQWHDEALPFIPLAVFLFLTVLKARLIILDFMRLRGSRPVLAATLLGWPILISAGVIFKAAAGF